MKKSFLTVCIHSVLFGSVLAHAAPASDARQVTLQPGSPMQPAQSSSAPVVAKPPAKAAAASTVVDAEAVKMLNGQAASEQVVLEPMTNEEVIDSLIDHDERLIVLSEGMLDEIERMQASLDAAVKEHAGLQTAITRAKWMLTLLSGFFLLSGLGLFYLAYRQMQRLKKLKTEIESELFKLESEVGRSRSSQPDALEEEALDGAWQQQFADFKQEVTMSLQQFAAEGKHAAKPVKMQAGAIVSTALAGAVAADHTASNVEDGAFADLEAQTKSQRYLRGQQYDTAPVEAQGDDADFVELAVEDDTSEPPAYELTEQDEVVAPESDVSASQFLKQVNEPELADVAVDLAKSDSFDVEADAAVADDGGYEWGLSSPAQTATTSDDATDGNEPNTTGIEIDEIDIDAIEVEGVELEGIEANGANVDDADIDDDLSALELETKSEREKIALSGGYKAISLDDMGADDVVDEDDLDEALLSFAGTTTDDDTEDEGAIEYQPQHDQSVAQQAEVPAFDGGTGAHDGAATKQADEPVAQPAADIPAAADSSDARLSVTHPHATKRSDIDAELGLIQEFAQVQPEQEATFADTQTTQSGTSLAALKSLMPEEVSEVSALEQVKSAYQQASEALNAKQTDEALTLYGDLIARYQNEHDADVCQYVARSMGKKASLHLEQGNVKQALRDYDALIKEFYDDESPSIARMVSDTLLSSSMLELISTDSVSASKIARATAYFGQQPKRRLLIEMFEILRLAQRREVASEVDVLRMTYKHAPEAIDWRSLENWASTLQGASKARVTGLLGEFKDWP